MKEILKEMTTEELKQLLADIRAELTNRIDRYVIYTHYCFSSSKYHHGKYRHWAKLVQSVDRSKSNGFAFVGVFLNTDKQDKVPVGSVVVEYIGCERKIRALRAKEDGFEVLIEKNSDLMAEFVNEVADIFERA